MPNIPDLAPRKFGVEIEYGGSSTAAVMAELRNAGLSTAWDTHNYTGHSLTEWVVKLDGSVSRGGELVSPPLDFTNPANRAQVTAAVACLKRAGATTSTQAGIHVHVDSSDLGANELNKLARLFTKFEDAIYRLASSGWATLRPSARTYCPPLNALQVRALSRARTEDQIRMGYYGGRRNAALANGHGHQSRYQGLNLHSHFYRRTVEFRVFNSSLNAERIQMYIALCVGLVADAATGPKRSINKAVRLGDMYNGTADQDKVLLDLLVVLRYKAGIPLVDYRRIKRFWADSRPQVAMMGR